MKDIVSSGSLEISERIKTCGLRSVWIAGRHLSWMAKMQGTRRLQTTSRSISYPSILMRILDD